jgi:hypothetical protein
VGLQVVCFGLVKKRNQTGGVGSSREKAASSTRPHSLTRRRPVGDGEAHDGMKARGGGAASPGSERSGTTRFAGQGGPEG